MKPLGGMRLEGGAFMIRAFMRKPLSFLAVAKHLTEVRVFILALSLLESSPSWKRGWSKACGMASYLRPSESRECRPEAGLDHNSQGWPFPGDAFPPVRPCLLKFHNLPKAVPVARHQELKHMSLFGLGGIFASKL